VELEPTGGRRSLTRGPRRMLTAIAFPCPISVRKTLVRAGQLEPLDIDGLYGQAKVCLACHP
jgi:hypothetical protein